MKNTFRKTLLASLIVPFALGAASTSAGTLVTDWGYVTNNTFSDATETVGEIPTLNGNGTNTLTWGTNSKQSSLSITNVNALNGLKTDISAIDGHSDIGGFVDGGVLTHTNNILDYKGAALETFNLNSMLTLTPALPVAGSSTAIETTFKGFFKETGNVAAANCGFKSTSGCDDIFTVGEITGAALQTADGFEFASSFDYDGYTYTLYLELLGLVILEDKACIKAGAAVGCVGLLTQEKLINDRQTRFRIAATEVPEPGTLALLGLGLAGLGMSRRKKAAKA